MQNKAMITWARQFFRAKAHGAGHKKTSWKLVLSPALATMGQKPFMMVAVALATIAFASDCRAQNPTPAITSISPASVNGVLSTYRVPGMTITVNGSNFVAGAQVYWNGSSRTTTFVNSGQLQVSISARDRLVSNAAQRIVPVTVVNPAPGGGVSNATAFTVSLQFFAYDSRAALDGSNAANGLGYANIWESSFDGSVQFPATQLTHTESFHPVLSPNGSKIAFLSRRSLDGSDRPNLHSTINVWVMNADGSGVTPLTQLTALSAHNFDPSWSPNGTKIVFTSQRSLDGNDAAGPNLTRNIWVMNADGSGATPLTVLKASGADSTVAAWSPDGAKIAYASQQALDGTNAANAAFNVWIMNADGSGNTPLTKLNGGQRRFLLADVVARWHKDSLWIRTGPGRQLYGNQYLQHLGHERGWLRGHSLDQAHRGINQL